MLVGREVECGRIDDLRRDAALGRGAAVLLQGDAGIGKSTLLQYAAASGAGGAMRGLRARGAESEAMLPFAGLLSLLRGVLGRLDTLPRPQADALGAALALRPADARGDRFAVYAATLGLLVATAEDGPVLVLVDDAQWLDVASAEALAFAAGRIGDDRVAMLAAARTGLDARLSRGFGRVDVAGLDGRALAMLAERVIGQPLAPGVAGALTEATGGNPLALLEAIRNVGGESLARGDPLPSPLPLGA